MTRFKIIYLKLNNSNIVKYQTIFLPMHSDYKEKDINILIKKINNYKHEV